MGISLRPANDPREVAAIRRASRQIGGGDHKVQFGPFRPPEPPIDATQELKEELNPDAPGASAYHDINAHQPAQGRQRDRRAQLLLSAIYRQKPSM